MQYSDLFVVTPSGDRTLVNSVYARTFDVQSGFKASTITFTVPKATADEVGIREGKFLAVTVDEKILSTPYVLEGSGYNYVTESGVRVVEYKGRSLHALGDDGLVLPSAWPNPTPSGHAFQNVTPGTIIKTLLTRAQERSTVLEWKHDSFTGTVDSNGKTWPAMMDRTYSNGDTLTKVIQDLVDDGVVEVAFDGFNLRAYVPGTLGRTLSPDNVIFRPGYSLSEGSVDSDTTDFATDIFAIGEGSAVTYLTRPELYSVLGRRKPKFVQYGGVSNTELLKVMAAADLDKYGSFKQEDSVSIPNGIYQPFTDYGLDDWVTLDRGDGTTTSVRIKQISFTESAQDGSWAVAVSLGTLLDSIQEKIQRRLDAITGANAGGGAVPNDKQAIKMAPAKVQNISITALPYLDNQARRKVVAQVDWSDVLTYSNGMPMGDVSKYEIAVKAGNAKDFGTVQTVTTSRAVLSGYEPDTQIQAKVRAFNTENLASDWTTSAVFTLVDNTPLDLAKTSNPVVDVRWQTLVATWDGKTAGGNPPSRDCAGVEVHVAASASFNPTPATRVGFIPYLYGSGVGGNVIVTDLDASTTYFIKFIPLGAKGTAGPVSDPTSATTTALVISPAQVSQINADLGKAKNDLYSPGGTVDQVKTTLTGQITNSTNMLLSKGTDLVANGTGYLGNNTNFSSVTYTTDGPLGTTGAFVATGDKNVFFTDQFIPIDPAKKYVGSVQVKELTNKGNAQMYVGLACFDSSGYQIPPHMYAHVGAANTTLAAPLNQGDTVVSLTSVTNWRLTNGWLGQWNYTDPKGKVWPVGTYTRNVVALKSIDTTNNTVTLNTPWPFAGLAKGQPVGNMIAGGTYLYNIAQGIAPADWKTYKSATVITGLHDGSTSAAATYAFPQGTTSVKVVSLANYLPSTGATTAFAAYSLSDSSAAQFTADNAAAAAATAKTTADNASTAAANAAGVANSKADVLVQSTAPVAAMQKSSTLWIDTTGNANTPKRWSGTSWVAVTDKAALDAANAAAAAQAAADTAKANAAAAQATANSKIMSYSSAIQPTAPTGGFTPGDIWVNTSDKNHTYRWSGSAWVDTRDGAISDAANTASKGVSDAAAALSAAQQAQATADGAISTYYQETAPWANGSTQPAAKLGDMWYKSSTNQAYRWDGSTWALIADTQITAALNAAQQAQTTADGKIDAFYQTTKPTSGSLGDLWFDTGNQNRQYYCSATNPLTWTLVADGRIADAQAAAAKAQSDAANAGTAAANAAGVAAAKADVIIASSEPAAALRKATTLWIDTTNGANTPKRWDGSAWAVVTDKTATDAANAAVAAKQAADAALSTANQAKADAATALSQANAAKTSADFAQASASGKNTISWDPGPPTSSTPGKAWGDIWYQFDIKDNKTRIIAAWAWNGQWVPSTLSETYLPQVNIGTGTYGDLDGIRLKAKSVQANTVVVEGSVDSTVIADGAVTTAKLVANAITADKISGNAVDVSKINASSITADNIAAQNFVGAIGKFIAITADQIKTGTLQAAISIGSAGIITAGDVLGAHAELSPTGFRSYSPSVDPNGQPALAVSLGTGSDDILTIMGNDGNTAASITQDGTGSFNDLDVGDDPMFKGQPLLGQMADPSSLPGWLDQLPRGVVAFGDARAQVTSLGKVTGQNPFMQIGFTLDPARAYRVTLPFMYSVSDLTATSRVGLNAYYTYSDTSTEPDDPVVGSGFVREVPVVHTVNTTGASNSMDFIWYPAEYGHLVNIKLMFTLSCSSSCNVTPIVTGGFTWQVTIEDIGPKPQETGEIVRKTPSSAAAKKNYVTTWAASDSQTFLYNGSKDDFGKSKGVVRTGYWNSATGDMKSVILFNSNAFSGETGKSIASALSGAVISKVEVFIQTVHWYNPTGGPLILRNMTGSSMPGSLSDSSAKSGGGRLSKTYTARNQGYWITVPNSWISASNRAILVGPPESQSTYSYGHVASHTHPTASYRPKLRISYTR